MKRKPNIPAAAALRHRAETRLSDQMKGRSSIVGVRRPAAGDQKSERDPVRVLHELELHEIELEMQNAELQKARDELETALENYTDLYDFAPMGYFSIDESGVILEANLTGSVLLGIERSRLINRRLLLFVSAATRPVFAAFLERVFTDPKDQACEAQLLKRGRDAFWAGFRAASALSLKGNRKWCRIAFADIAERKQAEEAQRHLEVLAASNRSLEQEIVRRRKGELALNKSERHQGRMLKESRLMQGQLRRLSHQILHAQEEERKRISRELHDEIAQTLVGINVRLAALTRDAVDNPGLLGKIARTQRLVEKSVDIVHRFARELRPTALDDLGLIPALHSFMNAFATRTGVRATLTAFADVEQLDMAKRTVLFRVAQESLTNVDRHAQASRVEVSIQKLRGGVCMKIRDDGKSFDVQRVLRANGGKRLGLLGMRERLEMIGGSFTVESAPGQGTAIVARIPLGKGI